MTDNHFPDRHGPPFTQTGLYLRRDGLVQTIRYYTGHDKWPLQQCSAPDPCWGPSGAFSIQGSLEPEDLLEFLAPLPTEMAADVTTIEHAAKLITSKAPVSETFELVTADEHERQLREELVKIAFKSIGTFAEWSPRDIGPYLVRAADTAIIAMRKPIGGDK